MVGGFDSGFQDSRFEGFRGKRVTTGRKRNALPGRVASQRTLTGVGKGVLRGATF